MADTNSPDDLLQIVAHLESLRRAGLLHLPRVDSPASADGFAAIREAAAALEPGKVADAPRTAEPVPREAKPEGTAEPKSQERLRPDKTEPPASLQEIVGPASSGTRDAAASKRPRESAAAKPRTKPVAAFFDQSRVPIESPVVPLDRRAELLRVLAEEVAACTRCPHLAATRTQTVFSSGTPSARLMFIGEAPGADEDRLGEPFVGRAGQLLTDIVSKGMGLSRSEVYIANVLKCRPPENRNPLPDEMANCRGFLDRQIEIVRPEFLCLLGKVAVGAILETSVPMKTLRLRWHRYRDIPTIVTWHPAYLLRNPEAKRDTWEDIQMLMAEMGLKPPARE